MEYLSGVIDGAIATDSLVREAMEHTSCKEEFSEVYKREIAYLADRIRVRRAEEVLVYLEGLEVDD